MCRVRRQLARVPKSNRPRVSAIAGVFQLDGCPVSRDAVAGMLAALAHRGGDAGAMWCGGAVGLAQTTRFSSPESMRGAGLLVADADRFAAVADARLDNRDELASRLGLERPSDASDCAIILAAYERWGSACAEHLFGDFAFAVWNARTRTLFCARDGMGVRPLYYVRTARMFAFASELGALLQLPGISRDVDEEQVAVFLGWTNDDRTRTMYKSISRLPAAHAVTVGRDGAAFSCHWRAASARDVRFADDAQYAEAFRELFSDAVRSRLRTTFPVGTTLSGGLDSSAIACEARRCLGQRADAPALHSFSLVFPSASPKELALIDERSYQDCVIRDGGLHAHRVRGDLLSPLADLPRMLRELGEPHYAPNHYLHRGMFEAARQAGVRVLLDGFDGDVAVSHGLSRLHSLARSGRWDVFEAEVRLFARNRAIDPGRVLPHFGFPYLSALARRGRAMEWARAARQLARRFGVSRSSIGMEHGLRPALERVRQPKPDTIWKPQVASVLARAARSGSAEPDAFATERSMHEYTLEQSVYQWTLEIADKSAAACGLELRYPFFDRRVIEFCVGLPEEQKFSAGWPRYHFRRAMEGILPPEIQWRSTKASLASNFHRRLLEADLAVLDSLPLDRLAPYMNVAELRRRCARYRGGSTRADADGALLFRSALLSTWLDSEAGSARPGNDRSGPRAPVAA